MSYRSGQPIRLEGDRRALRTVVQSLALSMACTSGIFALGSLVRYMEHLPWGSVDWLQVSVLTGGLTLAMALTVALGWRRPRSGPSMIVWLACAVVTITCGQLLLKALMSSRPLVIDYRLHLFAVGWICLIMGGYILFKTRRS